MYFPILSSNGIIIHLVKEMVELIKPTENTKKKIENYRKIITSTLQLLIVSSILAFIICIGVTSKLSFCSYQDYDSDSLRCLPSSEDDFSQTFRTFIHILINPVYFPLTISVIIPILISLAKLSNTHYSSKTFSWLMFMFLYSLFICDLVIYSRSQMFSGDDGGFTLVEPLHWRHPCASILRTAAVVTICSFYD